MEKVKRKMIPYSVYVPPEMHEELVAKAKSGEASSLIRKAIRLLLNDNNQFKAGYNQAILDVVKLIGKTTGINKIAYEGKYIDTLIVDRVKTLEMQ